MGDLVPNGSPFKNAIANYDQILIILCNKIYLCCSLNEHSEQTRTNSVVSEFVCVRFVVNVPEKVAKHWHKILESMPKVEL